MSVIIVFAIGKYGISIAFDASRWECFVERKVRCVDVAFGPFSFAAGRG